MEKIIFKIRGVLICLFYIVTVILGNMFQMLSLLVWPFSRKLFRQMNRSVAYVYWSSIAWGIDHVMRCQIRRAGDQLPLEENSVLIANHQTMSDIPVLLWVASRTKRIADMKWFLKDELKYVPGPGWGVRFLDGIFVKRNWADDKAGIFRTFHRILTNKIPFWVVNFPEGTRWTPAKFNRSVEFSKSRGQEPFTNVLAPRPKGFVATVQGLRESLQSVVDVTINYRNGVPKLKDFFYSVGMPIDVEVRRFPIESLPKSDEELSVWLTQRFREKDQFLKSCRSKNWSP